MNTIAITNEKGGVGKSTMAAHLAAGLATRGRNVLMLDTDPQGHLARLVGLPEEDGLYQLLVENAIWDDVLRLVPPERYAVPDAPPGGNLFLLPSATRTAVLAQLVQDPFSLDDRLTELEQAYRIDVVVMDTAPTASMFDSTIYFAADAFLYVTVCEALAFDGIKKSMAKIQRFGLKRREYGMADNALLGILPNMVRARTWNHRANLETLAAAFPGRVWTPVAERTKWTEASNVGQLVFAYAPTSGEARDAWEMVDQAERVLAR